MNRRGMGSGFSAAPFFLVIALALAVAAGWQLTGFRPVHDQAAFAPLTLHTLDAVNLRSDASPESDILAVIPAGETLEQASTSRDGYAPVGWAGQRGWVALDWVASGPAPAGEIRAATTADMPQSEPVETETALSAQGDAGQTTTGEATRASTASAHTGDVGEATAGETTVGVEDSITDDVEVTEDIASEPVPQSGEKWIEVDRSDQTVTLHDGEIVVAQFSALLGRDPSADGYYSTAIGTYHVYSMNPDLTETPFVDDVYLTDWVGFDPVRSNGFHSPTRYADGTLRQNGGTVTMGCVRLSEENARLLFDFAEIGMRVEIHD